MEETESKQQSAPLLWLRAGIQVAVCETVVLSHKVTLETLGRLESHLDTVLWTHTHTHTQTHTHMEV